MNKNEDGELEPFEITGDHKVIFNMESRGNSFSIYMEDEEHSDSALGMSFCRQEVTELRDYLNRYLETTSGISSKQTKEPLPYNNIIKESKFVYNLLKANKDHAEYCRKVMESWMNPPK
jgi:hypothetical protein